MLDHHSATVLPFRASARRAPGLPSCDHARLGNPDGIDAATHDNVVPLRDNVIVLADLARWQMRRPGSLTLSPPPGGQAA
jgi:hypothetical protein